MASAYNMLVAVALKRQTIPLATAERRHSGTKQTKMEITTVRVALELNTYSVICAPAPEGLRVFCE